MVKCQELAVLVHVQILLQIHLADFTSFLEKLLIPIDENYGRRSVDD